MTNNQIQFYKAREDRRHNLAVESETATHNRAQEDIGWGNIGATYANIDEQKRHNVATEGINWYSARNLGYLQGSQAHYNYVMSDYTAGPKTEQTQVESQYTSGPKTDKTRAETKNVNTNTWKQRVQTVREGVGVVTDIVGLFSPIHTIYKTMKGATTK